MVGFDPSNNKPLPKQYYGYAGAISGVVTRAVAQPIDVIKIRFQVVIHVRHSHNRCLFFCILYKKDLTLVIVYMSGLTDTSNANRSTSIH